ncbi:MAG: hypothetical protein K0S31_1462 [Sphingobacterium multivorum]|jgi:hypothetical protein|nr:hypothetical protein [Sphingobacterium multivorum]
MVGLDEILNMDSTLKDILILLNVMLSEMPLEKNSKLKV